jgi:hypothetical protein
MTQKEFELGLRMLFQDVNRRMPDSEVLEGWYDKLSFMRSARFFQAVDRLLGEEFLTHASMVGTLKSAYNAINKEQMPEPEQPSTGLTSEQQIAWSRSIRLQIAQTAYAKKSGTPIPNSLKQPNMDLLDDEPFKEELVSVECYRFKPEGKRSQEPQDIVGAMV